MTIRLNGQTSGYVELEAPATAGSNTLVLPTGNGTSGQYLQTNGSGTLSWQTVTSTEYQGPTFQAKRTSAQTLPSATTTKLQFDVVSFDTDSDYDNTTNYRFTPSKAGYYACFLQPYLSVTVSGATTQESFIFKNGSQELFGRHTVGYGFYATIPISGIIYLNGSTDYIEAYGFNNGSTPILSGSSTFGATWVHD